ncbi:MAG: isochorismatase family protein [Actinomycetota bacterium]
MSETAALVIVDVQNDFCDIPSASLPVTGGVQVARDISDFVTLAAVGYTRIAATRDWHEDPGDHFSDEPDFVDTWPHHCVAGSEGAEFHADLDLAEVDAVFSKGRFSASYTGFDGSNEEGAQLGAWLQEAEVERVDVVGLATDHCVRATALDAAAAGFRTRVLLPLTAGVAPETTDAAIEQLHGAGVELVGTLPPRD